MKTIKDLKKMIAEPASKEWFEKHGSPKHKALDKSKHLKVRHERDGGLYEENGDRLVMSKGKMLYPAKHK